MSQYPVENIRTVALVGHGSTGKTTLMEALLYRNGVIKEVGTVEKGNTVGDFDPMEKEVKHSLRTTVAHLNAQKDDGTPVKPISPLLNVSTKLSSNVLWRWTTRRWNATWKRVPLIPRVCTLR